jgi:hypothetical protein
MKHVSSRGERQRQHVPRQHAQKPISAQVRNTQRKCRPGASNFDGQQQECGDKQAAEMQWPRQRSSGPLVGLARKKRQCRDCGWRAAGGGGAVFFCLSAFCRTTDDLGPEPGKKFYRITLVLVQKPSGILLLSALCANKKHEEAHQLAAAGLV